MSTIDLSSLPAPTVVDELDYESILSELISDFTARHPEHTALLESDPLYKLAEVAAYRELALRQDMNDKAKACLLAHSSGADLDNLAALVPVLRLVVDPGDPDASPPVSPKLESDESLRRRTQLAPESFSVAGPDGAYKFHALAVPGVHDANVHSPNPGDVVVSILATDGDGSSPAELIDDVAATLNGDDVRPFTDHVTVQSAEIVSVAITATLYVKSGPSSATVLEAAQANITKLLADFRFLSFGLPLSAVYAALHISGVTRVDLVSPAADIICDWDQAIHCTNISIGVADG